MISAFGSARLAWSLGLYSAVLIININHALAQDQPVNATDTTVTYPASYFEQYQPYSVNDMLDRIPGINVARGNSGSPQGGPGSSDSLNRRGLGAGGDQVLINGKRLAGKENEGNDQLSRIPASQVQYIEIIRGTSGDLDVKGGNQVINIVLLQAESSRSVAFEANVDHYDNGNNEPGAKLAVNGQRGAFEYFLSGEREPRWELRDGYEISNLADGSLNDTIDRQELRDGRPITLVSNLGYQFSDQDTGHLNLQWSNSDAPGEIERIITSYTGPTPVTKFEFEDTPIEMQAYEVGGDYEHVFANGSRFKTLFIVNEDENDLLRERFEVEDSTYTKDLYVANSARNRERIVRSTYKYGLTAEQDLEVGVERAQTILDTSLQVGVLTGGISLPAFGGLSPVTNANGTVEEIRYEYFAIHNWQLNTRMSLESTLLYETSEISQSGDVQETRDFDFIRPKLDYRFDITPSIQFRASIEKDVAQLSFADFTASAAQRDDDQNAVAGNPALRQEQSWRYETNLEYRLPGDSGVISGNLFYHDLEDVIEKVDVSTPTQIQSANGNIGDGERYGVNIDSSLRLGFINQPDMLFTAGVAYEDSNVIDPFTGDERRLSNRGKGSANIGLRHDIPRLSMNWGFSIQHSFYGDTIAYDIDKIEDYYDADDFLRAWVETQGWGGLTYRFEAMDAGVRCRARSRYINGTIGTGILNEIEDSCSETGPKLALKVRGSF